MEFIKSVFSNLAASMILIVLSYIGKKCLKVFRERKRIGKILKEPTRQSIYIQFFISLIVMYFLFIIEMSAQTPFWGFSTLIIIINGFLFATIISAFIDLGNLTAPKPKADCNTDDSVMHQRPIQKANKKNKRAKGNGFNQ